MAQERYWFEGVPEKDRFWFLPPAADDPPVSDPAKDPPTRLGSPGSVELGVRQWCR
jgi:hypothetical protein